MRYQFDYKHFNSVNEMPAEDQQLVAEAFAATEKSNAPFSKFRVGAAARLESGRIETGSNQESEVFPSGMCAERTLLYAHEAHSFEDKITALAIASKPSERECYPCGGCRQVLLDVERRQGSPIRIIMCSETSISEVPSATNLLPFQFEL